MKIASRLTKITPKQRVYGDRRSEERDENEMRTHRARIGFWVRMLHGCQDGPTLFWPYPDNNEFQDLPEVPRYLFGAFDVANSGKSDETRQG
jgi:hypothetical protein